MAILERSGILAALALAALCAGCSDQSRSEYASAGKEAGAALKSDVKKGATAAKAATQAAALSLKEHRIVSVSSKPAAPPTVGARIQAALSAATDLSATKISVKQVGSKIVLFGSVPTAADKHRAAEIASGVAGSKYNLVDKLTVQKA